jgi:hypothetical protein
MTLAEQIQAQLIKNSKALTRIARHQDEPTQRLVRNMLFHIAQAAGPVWKKRGGKTTVHQGLEKEEEK